MINAPENDSEQLMQALENGNAVGVCFSVKPEETLGQKVQRIKKDLPYITQVELKGDTLLVTASKPFSKIRFIGQNGMELDVQKYKRTGMYVIKQEDNYVRTELAFNDWTRLYLNPITRHESSEIVKQRLDYINWTKTIILWIVYILFILVICKTIKRCVNK